MESDQMESRMSMRSTESIDSGVSFKRVSSNRARKRSHLMMTTGSTESIDSGVSLKSDQSKAELTNFKDRVSPRPDNLIGPDIDPVGDHDDIVRLRKLLPSCITSCVSVRRKDSQGCTADVKDTPPSPEEKPDDLIGPDIDLRGDHDDLRATGSIESIDSGVSLKSYRSKAEQLDFKVSPRRGDEPGAVV